MNGMNFDLGARPALQPVSSNIAMNSPAMNSFKHLPHLRRGHSELSPSPSPFYSQPHSIGQSNFNNPLAFGRSQLAYTNQFNGNGTFGEESKPLVSGFQPINMMNGLPLNPYPMPNGGNSYYAASAPQEETGDFEV
ncbi:hypothetical protein BR93DRAFT_929347 [Coniochaeta sp. PMI_546]|nr:hypothetical protein BR93DRAFT_929347 [Coniochaeta sp. PMI_546]